MRAAPEPGQLVTVRDRQWVVSDVRAGAVGTSLVRETGVPDDRRAAQHLVTLTSIEDDARDEEMQVVWELEVGTSARERHELPAPPADPDRFDPPDVLDAYLDAVRWGAITNADRDALQAPFRSGVQIEDYQLDPVVRALRMPRTNLLVADDVGLGKTIEAGLVLQELLLRHRARSALIICPAGLQVQWRDEMAEKFGLEFRIVDRELLRRLRRTRGPYTNPWTHFPRLITSVDWVKRGRPLRLLREALPVTPGYPRALDLMIVDEVHGCAPSGTGRYAVDSLRTKLLRLLAPHVEHRLFLSATPHNGYQESFSALLELLDDQRFARGVPPEPAQVARVMVRRLKSELTDWDGARKFPPRVVRALPVSYGAAERQAYDDLMAYADSRREGVADSTGRYAANFVLTLLKKRMFSSPEAFARTLAAHERTVTGREERDTRDPAMSVLTAATDRVDEAGEVDEEYGDRESDALSVAQQAIRTPLTPTEQNLLGRLRDWAERARNQDDARLTAFLRWWRTVVEADPEARVIVFTEYRDTQRWLHDRLVAHGLGTGERIALLYGGMDTEEREQVKAAFQAAPEDSPVRILLATDAASEGISLQRHCHRLLHWEIPWNPNRLEQRNGRVDRHGQTAAEVLVHHYVSAQSEDPGSLDGDLEFLGRVVTKVEQIRVDLGSVGPVVADQVVEAMTGRRRSLDTTGAEARASQRRVLKVERDLAGDLQRLNDRLRESRADLGVYPDRVERALRTALHLAGQPDLRVAAAPDGVAAPVFRLPPMTGSWAQARTVGLLQPMTGRERLATFDRDAVAGRDDLVHLHLGHPLVSQAVRLLRAEVWGGSGGSTLSRVTARVVPDDVLDTPAVIAHARVVVTGGGGSRLHEELATAGGVVREGRFRQFRTRRELDAALAAATGDPPGPEVLERLAALWPALSEGLAGAIAGRANERAESMARRLDERRDKEQEAVRAVLAELATSIDRALGEPPPEQLDLFSTGEREQYRVDREALQRRRDAIGDDVDREVAAVAARYADQTVRMLPVAVTFLVPRRKAGMSR